MSTNVKFTSLIGKTPQNMPREGHEIEDDFRGAISFAHILVTVFQHYIENDATQNDLIAAQDIAQRLEEILIKLRSDYERNQFRKV